MVPVTNINMNFFLRIEINKKVKTMSWRVLNYSSAFCYFKVITVGRVICKITNMSNQFECQTFTDIK